MGRPRKGSRTGRPTVMTPIVLRKLREAYLFDATDEQAAHFAGIGVRSLYDYQEKNPDFSQQKAQWKQDVRLRAKKTLSQGIDKDPDLALKLLERREPDNYSTKVDHTGNFQFNVQPGIVINGVEKTYNIGKKAINPELNAIKSD